MAADVRAERRRATPRRARSSSLTRLQVVDALARAGRWMMPGDPGPGSLARRGWIAGAVVGAATAVVMLIRLLVPTQVGTTDAGGRSLLCRMGLANTQPFGVEAAAGYLYPRWVPHQWYGETCGTDAHVSTMTPILWLGRQVTSGLGLGPGLDVRAVAVVAVLVLSALIGVLVALLPGRWMFRAMAGLLVLGITADSAFADMIGSTNLDSAALLGVLALVVGLRIVFGGVPGPGRLLILIGCAGFALAALPIMLSWLPVLVVAVLWRPAVWWHRAVWRQRGTTGAHPGAAARRAAEPSGSTRVWRSVRSRLPAVLAAIALVVIGSAVIEGQPGDRTREMRHDALFVEILPRSPDPAGDLAWFGLSPELAAGAGRPITDPGSGVGRPEYAAVADRVTWWRVALFTVSHPDRWPDKLDRGVAALTQPVQRHLGVHTVDSGAAPFAPDTRWTPISGPLSVVGRAVPLLVPALQMAVLALAVAVANRPRFGPAAQGIAAATAWVVVGIWVQFWAVMTYAGTDIARQMLPVTYAHWLLIPLGLVLALVLFWSRPADELASG